MTFANEILRMAVRAFDEEACRHAQCKMVVEEKDPVKLELLKVEMWVLLAEFRDQLHPDEPVQYCHETGRSIPHRK